MTVRLPTRATTQLAAAAACLLVTPTGARAQTAATNAASAIAWSKTEAILGAPSALQAILAQQSGISAAPAIRPTSYSLPRPVPAIMRTFSAAGGGALSGRPDVFGSVALRVGHTPLDSKWRRAENMIVHGSAAQFAESLRGRSPVERLEAVNRYVNRRVDFVDDQRRWGRPDVWSTADATLRSGRGDCEDYAIAKLQMLRRAGIADHDLYLVIVRDLVRREDHAVLVARAAGHMFLLDNGTDDVLDSDQVSDYRPVLTFASYGEWTHGYRVNNAPINVASAGESTPTLVADASDQRSRSASLLAFNAGFNK